MLYAVPLGRVADLLLNTCFTVVVCVVNPGVPPCPPVWGPFSERGPKTTQHNSKTEKKNRRFPYSGNIGFVPEDWPRLRLNRNGVQSELELMLHAVT